MSGFTQAMEVSPPISDCPFPPTGEPGCAEQGPELWVVLDIRWVLLRQTGILSASHQRLWVCYASVCIGHMSWYGLFWFCVSDVSSLTINLSHRRDATFYLCGEVSRFISRLCFRVYEPDTVPLESAWFLFLDFRTSDGKFMKNDEFLVRLKMTNKVTAASNLKATGLHFNKKSSKAVIDETADSVKSDFITSAKRYIEHLLRGVLQHTGLSSDIIKGLAAFDPYIMMKRPTEVALRHFGILYSVAIKLRSWVTGPNEAACRDEYLALLDYLRTYHSSNPSLTDDSCDLIEFLMGLDFLQTHEHLNYLFKLSCLCLTSVSPRYPAVVMGKVDTQGLQSRISDVVLPRQSYLSEVSDSLALCCTDVSLEKFSMLSSSFGQSGLCSDFDLWTYVDNFGRSSIYKSFMSSYRSVLSGAGTNCKDVTAADVPSVRDAPAFRLPSDTQRRRMERSQSRSKSSSVVMEATTSSSKDWFCICIYVHVDCKLCLFLLYLSFCFFDFLIPYLFSSGRDPFKSHYLFKNTFLGLVKRKR